MKCNFSTFKNRSVFSDSRVIMILQCMLAWISKHYQKSLLPVACSPCCVYDPFLHDWLHFNVCLKKFTWESKCSEIAAVLLSLLQRLNPTSVFQWTELDTASDQSVMILSYKPLQIDVYYPGKWIMADVPRSSCWMMFMSLFTLIAQTLGSVRCFISFHVVKTLFTD